MIDLKDIYAATEGGKRIIMDLVPQASETKNFSYRSDDKHPSARLYPPREGRDHWILKDFGESGQEATLSPIDVYMREKGYSSHDFHLAVQMLAKDYGVTNVLDENINRPIIEKRPSTDEEKEGEPSFRRKESISVLESSLWGPCVKAEHVKSLGWSSLEWIASAKDGQTTIRRTTDAYPIFLQENKFCDHMGNERFFYKVYQPYCVKQDWRFYSIGTKPQDYIFGMDALIRRYNLGEQEPLDAVCLVSGGSDAVNCLSMGLQPIWLNSETQELTPAMYARIKKYAKDIYVCYDADDTGIAAAQRLALQYLDIKVIWLPRKELNAIMDKRGKPLKDLKDWLHLHPSPNDFERLLRSAREARFWHMWKDNGEKDNAKWNVNISLTRLCYFLRLNGYVVLRDELYGESHFVHIVGKVVEEVTLGDIHRFLKDWMVHNGLPDMIIDKVMRSRDMQGSLLALNMEEMRLDFSTATPTSQLFYFKNGCVKVTKDEITHYAYNRMPADFPYVWKHHIIQHDYVEHEPMFSISRQEDGSYGINVLSTASEMLCFYINSSRNNWRKEMEYRFEGDPEGKDEYARTHKFCIDGDGLTDEEIAEQMQSMVNKIFSTGYHAHDYKMMSRAWASICYDNHIGENDECNGRTGKSLYGKILRCFLQTVTIEAKNRNITERQFLYANVNYDTQLLFVDECHRHLDYDHFYARITDDFQVEKKGCDPETIPFANSPKILIATNYINRKQDASTEARELPVVFSDYYHQKAKNNDYLENRSVADDFGHNLIDDHYEGWGHDISFLLQCVQFYLSVIDRGEKILPPLKNIRKRQQKATMGKSFEMWAEDYYQEGSSHLNVAEKLDDVYQAYKREAQSHAVDIEPFNKKLQEYSDSADHIAVFNPSDITGKEKDGQRWRKHESNGQVRYIYMRSTSEALRMARDANPIQAELSFDSSPNTTVNDEDMPF